MTTEGNALPPVRNLTISRMCFGERCWDAPFTWAQIRAELQAADAVRSARALDTALARLGMTREEATRLVAEYREAHPDTVL